MAKFSPLVAIPPLIFAGLAGLFFFGMFRENPDDLPSTFIGRDAPAIAAEPLPGYPTFDRAALDAGELTIVNFWASWCPPCRAEHGALMQLADEGYTIYGVNNRDQQDNALAFLDELGNPFSGITVDANGRQSIDWGVVALPETFILNAQGEVVFKFSGPIHGVLDTVIRRELAAADG